MSNINKTTLQSYYQNAGDVYSDLNTEACLELIADAANETNAYARTLVSSGSAITIAELQATVVKHTVADITLYVSTTGNDLNIGSSPAAPLRNIMTAVNLAEQMVNHTVAILVADGAYPEDIFIYGRHGKGVLRLLGASSLAGAANVIVNKIHYRYNTIPIYVTGFTATTITDTAILAGYNPGYSEINYCRVVAAAADQRGFGNYYSPYTLINECEVSNRVVGIYTSGVHTWSVNNTGSNNVVGLYAEKIGKIVKTGTQPDGATKEDWASGGSIVDGAKKAVATTTNKAVNGNVDIWQQGEAFTFSSSSGYTADNWFFTRTGTGLTTVTKDTTIPANGKSKYSHLCVGSYGAGEIQENKTVIESHNAEKLSGQAVEISVQHRESTSAGTVTPSIVVMYASAADNFTTVEAVNISSMGVSAAFALHEYSLILPATSPINNYPIGNGIQIVIRHQQNGATGTLITGICQVKIHPGTSPIEYEPKDYTDELRDCLRLWQQSFTYGVKPAQNLADYRGSLAGSQIVAASTPQYGVFGTIQLCEKMRKIPAVTTYNIAAANAEVRNFGTGTDCSSTVVSNISDGAFRIDTTMPAASSSGQVCMVQWTADARYTQV